MTCDDPVAARNVPVRGEVLDQLKCGLRNAKQRRSPLSLLANPRGFDTGEEVTRVNRCACGRTWRAPALGGSRHADLFTLIRFLVLAAPTAGRGDEKPVA